MKSMAVLKTKKQAGNGKKIAIPHPVVEETLQIYTPGCKTVKEGEAVIVDGKIGVCANFNVKGHFYADAGEEVDHFTDIEATLCYNQMAYALLFFLVAEGYAKQVIDESSFTQTNLAYFRDDSLLKRMQMHAAFLARGGNPLHIKQLDMLRLMARLSTVDPSRLKDIQFMLSFIIAKNNVKFWKPISIDEEFEGSLIVNRYICKRPHLIFLDTHYDFENGKAVGDVMLAIKFGK